MMNRACHNNNGRDLINGVKPGGDLFALISRGQRSSRVGAAILDFDPIEQASV